MANLLLTGFEPFGSHTLNPSALIAEQLNGEQIGQHVVTARILPVSLQGLTTHIERLLQETQPLLVINLGLATGSTAIRLERVALNLADFELPDNQGLQCADQPLLAHGPQALASTLPLRAICDALLAAGIPAYLSNSAGAYLCNAAMYYFLLALQARAIPCGFIHVPALPEQVAADLAERGSACEPLASMSLSLQIQAIRIALEHSSQALQ
jgi:pyroglutamyl-peptidase